jgi:hypothetical protein
MVIHGLANLEGAGSCCTGCSAVNRPGDLFCGQCGTSCEDSDAVRGFQKRRRYERGDTIQIAPPPDGNMVGYPSYTAYGISLKTEFNKDLKFAGKIQVTSSLKPANAEWGAIDLLDQGYIPGVDGRRVDGRVWIESES